MAAGLLAVAGVAKLREPDGARRALEALGLSVGWSTVRLVGAAEVVLGAAAVVSGSRWVAAAVAFSFLVFAAVGMWLLVGPAEVASCGCLGALEAPPSALHVLVSLLGSVAAGLAALLDPARLDQVLASSPAAGVPLLIGVGAGVAASVLAIAYVPILAFSYKGEANG